MRLTTNSSHLCRALTSLFLSLCGTPAIAALVPITYQPTPANLNDLDHHNVYTWRIDTINVPASVTDATLTFTNIANWDTNPNVLHIHLLDTAINPGVASFVDDPTASVPVLDLTDDFISARYHADPAWLVAAGTNDLLLGNPSFSMTGTDYSITFDATALAALNSYINNGHDLAFGFDPDCHFFNDGISFTMGFTPVSEASTMAPVALLAAVASLFEIRRRRRVDQTSPISLRIEPPAMPRQPDLGSAVQRHLSRRDLKELGRNAGLAHFVVFKR